MNVGKRWTSGRLPSCAAVALGLLGMLLAGCSPGVRWRGVTFDPVHADARRDQKLTLVYLRHWAVVACTEFEENVLSNPAVLEMLRPEGSFYCAVLDFHWDRPLADRWGIEEPPGVVILDPGDRVLARLSGEISLEQMLEALQSAQNELASQTPPAPGP